MCGGVFGGSHGIAEVEKSMSCPTTLSRCADVVQLLLPCLSAHFFSTPRSGSLSFELLRHLLPREPNIPTKSFRGVTIVSTRERPINLSRSVSRPDLQHMHCWAFPYVCESVTPESVPNAARWFCDRLGFLQDTASFRRHQSPRSRRIALLEVIRDLGHGHELDPLMLFEVLDEPGTRQLN